MKHWTRDTTGRRRQHGVLKRMIVDEALSPDPDGVVLYSNADVANVRKLCRDYGVTFKSKRVAKGMFLARLFMTTPATP
jgi:hypothetical protein